MNIKKNFVILSSSIFLFLLASCGGPKNLIIPRAVTTADAIPATALNLNKGDYDILASVTETASVTATYSNNSLKIVSGDGEFAYYFSFKPNQGWSLQKFSGIANFGYLQQDGTDIVDLPTAEEFARRVAIARLIEVIKDYGADGALEPIITTRTSNVKNNVIEYQASATAKIVKIHTSK